jgi:hypothetical protein
MTLLTRRESELLIEQNKLEELHEALSENRIQGRAVLRLLPFALTTNMGCAKLLLESELRMGYDHDKRDFLDPVKTAICVGAYGYALQILSLVGNSGWQTTVLDTVLTELYSKAAGHEQGSKHSFREFFAHLPEELTKKSLCILRGRPSS